jgi:hypothetical protein
MSEENANQVEETIENQEAVESTVETPEVETPEVENPEVSEEVPAEEVNKELGVDQLNQDEFNKLYFQMKQQERELEALRQQQEQYNINEQYQTPTNNAQPSVDKVPSLEEFDYDEEAYTAAMIDYKVRKGVESAINKQAESYQVQQQQQYEQQIAQDFNSKAAKFAAENPDYEKVIDSYGNMVQYSPAVQAAILTSENGPQLDYMLLKNPQLVEKLNQLPEHMAYMELGKLEGQAVSMKPTAKKVSQAPAPIEDVSTGGNAANKDFAYDADMSMDEYYAKFMANKTQK